MTGLIHLASYPRSGNTLLRMILWQCFGLKTVSEYDESVRFAGCPVWPSLVGTVEHWNGRLLGEIAAEQGIVPFKTHAHPGDTAYPDTPAIYIIRDGREVCVSYWRYHHDILGRRDVSLRDVIRGDCMFGSWSAHVKAWGPVRLRPPLVLGVNVPSGGFVVPQDMATALMAAYDRKNLNLRYEEMTVDPAGTLGVIARFLGREPIGRSITPWDQVHRADPAFFRAGRNDTWRELMTGDDQALFDELHGETMREYGYCEIRHVQPV